MKVFLDASEIVVFDVKVCPEMPRKQGKAVPEGNGLVPHHDEFGPDQPAMADMYDYFKKDSIDS